MWKLANMNIIKMRLIKSTTDPIYDIAIQRGHTKSSLTIPKSNIKGL